MDILFDTTNRDLVLSKGDLILTENLDNNEVVQKVQQRLSTHYGEWFLNKDIGVPYLTRFMSIKGSDNELTRYLIGVIKLTEGVSDVKSVKANFDRRNRTYSLSCDIIPTYSGSAIRFTFNSGEDS